MATTISKQNFKFLKTLGENNNKDWFAKNREQYEEALANTKAFVEDLKKGLEKTDEIEKAKLYRIYRDVRFSKDKTPYKINWSCGFVREGKRLRGGYYLLVQPGGNSMVGGGFYNPNSADLKLIRDKIAQDDGKELTKILNAKKFKDMFGELHGDKLKTAPKGFPKDHPAIALLRHKNFYCMKKFTDKEVCDESFLKEAIKTHKAIRPFFDYMSDVLTTDMNGEPLF